MAIRREIALFISPSILKEIENIYRAVNIALVNELKVCFDRMGLDVSEVIEAAVPLVVDTRNATRQIVDGREKILKA